MTTSATADSSGPGLRRAVSRWEIVGLAINSVIGSGIYLLPAAAAGLLGSWSILAVALAGAAVLLLVLCFAEASSYYDEPGGSYLYTKDAFGAFIGFEVGWMTWLARIASVASLSNGLALALAFLWPGAADGTGRVMVITLAIASLAWINVVGVKAGARTAVGLTIGKTLPLLFFILVGFFFADWELVSVAGSPDTGRLGEAALLLLFAYAGFETTPAAAGEYKDPKRDLPIALIIATLTIITIYCLIQAVSLATLPGLADSESPLAEAATGFLGGWGGLLMTVGAVVSIFGNMGNTALMGPRFLYALSIDGFGPKSLGKVHPRYRTPAAAIIVQSALAAALALSGSFVQLAMLSVVARLATYLGTAAAVPVLRKKFGGGGEGFQLPGGPLIPILAILLSLGFLASAEIGNLVAAVIVIAVGAVVYKFRSAGPDLL